MEVEAKLRVPDEETFQRLLEINSLAGLPLWPVPPVDVRDCYFDTADGDLWAAGVACRVRTEGSRSFGTIKGLGDAEGAIHRRIEYEVELEQAFSPTRWPASEAQALVESLSRGKPLHPLFHLKQERHRRVARETSPATGRAVAELSLDRVEVCEGETTIDRYLEVEAELLPDGSVEELDRLVRHLADEWALNPEPRSKFERALALFHPWWVEREGVSTRGGAAAPFPTRAATAARAEIELDDLMSEAGRKTMRQQFQKMLANEPGTRLGEDPEALHDMRVATRRMRAAFRVFGDYYEQNEIEGYKRGLRDTGRALGPVRDLDVFIEKVQAYLETMGPDAQGSLDRLLLTLARKREAARTGMLAYLDGAPYARFKEEFGLFCETEGMDSRPVAADAAEIAPHRVHDVAPVVIYKRLAVVRAYDERVRSHSASLKQLHALRIACKRLRYTLEFFQAVLGPDVKKVIQEIVKMQDHLGAIQDVVVARELLQKVLVEQGPDPGIEQYLNYRAAEMGQLLATVGEAWLGLNNPEFDRMVAQTVAGR
ncbi:MAG: CHAD domain-containing protein [Anaerolineae bacterium]|nr:CHAD domain-containing protein [Anaerolineae bacterium]